MVGAVPIRPTRRCVIFSTPNIRPLDEKLRLRWLREFSLHFDGSDTPSTRIFEMTRSAFSPAELLDDCANTLRDAIGFRPIRIALAATSQVPPVVTGDREHLAIVLRQLAEQAVDAIDSGEIRLEVHFDGEQLVWELSAADSSRVDPRLLSLAGRTGQKQLRSLLRIIERLHARLSIRQATGRSRHWVLHMPAQPVRPSACVTSRPHFSAASPKGDTPCDVRPRLNALVVADVPQNARLLRYLLEKEQFEVTAMSSLEGARTNVTERLRRGLSFDLILVDLPLAEAAAGTVMQTLRTAGHSGALLGLASTADADVLAMEIGDFATGLLTKPLNRSSLAESLKQSLPAYCVEETASLAAAR